MEFPLDPDRIVFDADGLAEFVWPVSMREIQQVRDGLIRNVADCIKDETILQILGKHFILESLSVYRAYALSTRLKQDGYRPVGSNSRYFPAIADGNQPKSAPLIEALFAGKKPTTGLYRYFLEFRWNGLNHNPFGPRNPNDILAHPGSQLVSLHARRERRTVRCTKHSDWFSEVDRTNTPISQSELADCIGAVRTSFAIGGEELPGFLADYLEMWLREATAAVAVHFERLLEAEEYLPNELWTGTGGNVWAKMLRYATRGTGGRVVGHDHGYGAGFDRDHKKELIEFDSCDEFVTHNIAQADCLRRNTDRSLLATSEPPEIVALPEASRRTVFRPPTGLKSRLLSRYSRVRSSTTDTVDRIMYVPTLYQVDQSRFAFVLGAPVAIDWQARLLRHLSTDWGYDVLHKPHPGGEGQPPRGFSDHFGVEMIRRPFEEVIHRADAFLFDYPHTTAFGSALAANKPVVLVDFGIVDWDPDALEMLERRCAIVDGWFDEENRAQVDWSALETAISVAPDLQDQTFVETYLAPTSVRAN